MFCDAVRAEQARHGAREANARRAARGGFAAVLTAEAIAFIAERDSAYLATASRDGQPYVQHRGGPKGFIAVLDPQTLAFADYPGNRQFISAGHLAENPRAFLFLMDYADARRLKLWGSARISEDAALLARLKAPAAVTAERAIVFALTAADWNCAKYIPRLVAPEEA